MDNKKFLLILGILIIFISVIGAYASEYKPEYGDLNFLLDETNESELTGCCSIACQLDGNNSIMAFRRDSPSGADIYIENISWHGKDAIKQYKTDGKYFCQVIVTNDGWTVGFGGLDDGEVNEKIENITGEMIANNTCEAVGTETKKVEIKKEDDIKLDADDRQIDEKVKNAFKQYEENAKKVIESDE